MFQWCSMKSLLIGSAGIALVASGCSNSGAPPPSASSGANSAPAARSRAYLGKEADVIRWIVLRPSGVVVLLSEPCGVQQDYFRAKLFSYEPTKATPAAEHDGCYSEKGRTPGPEGMITVYESDGTTIGKSILEVSVSEAFTPKYFFLPLDNDPRNTRPRIEAVGVSSSKYDTGTDYFPIGLTRQPCPFDKAWLLARHIPEGNADSYERCWQERGNSVVLRDATYSENEPPKLSPDGELVDKAGFFSAATLATTPVKYDWSSR